MHFEKDLNPQQLEAVQHVEGPLLIIAGAGSGKTRVVTYRIAYLLNLGVPASEILALTFTNKAAEEMKKRIQILCDVSILASTFHSLGARILRESISALGFQPHFSIFDEEDSEKVLKECLEDLALKEDRAFFKSMRLGISHAKNQLLDPSAVDEEPLKNIYHRYQEKLRQYNAVDFDDLLFLTVKLFQLHPEVLNRYQKRWNFILIDEYQDTNHAQAVLVKLLAGTKKNVFAVGDPDQSIYSWRGALIENILNFSHDFPEAHQISLEQNYRSRTNILNAANALITHNAGRYEKNLWSQRGEGEKIGLFLCEDEREEVAFVINRIRKHCREENIPLSDCAIFYRTHFQSRIFEDGLLRERIPYVIIGGLSFYMRKEIKDILAFLRMILDGSDFLAFARTFFLHKRGIGQSTLSKLRFFAQEQHRDLFSTCQDILDQKLSFKLSQKQIEGLKDYVQMIEHLRKLYQGNQSLYACIKKTIEITRYLEVLKEDPETFQERRENVEELLSKALEWEEEQDTPSLVLFLEELTLKSSHEEKDPTKETLKLMTLHHAKGLEFSFCFLVGMEEELFPHLNALGSFEALEEERRLCYVGMTRAKEFLYLSAARNRHLWGAHRYMRPSRFLSEIPKEYLRDFHIPEKRSHFEEEEKTFEPGDRVLHRDFGWGIVKKTYQTSLGLTYDVFFPESETMRTLVAKYAKLTTDLFN